MKLTQLECTNCGSHLNMPKLTLTHTLVCPACDAHYMIDELVHKEIQFPPTKIITFQQNSQNFRYALLTWLSDGELVPDDVLKELSVKNFSGLYVPFWNITGDFDAQFTCEYQDEIEVRIQDKNGNWRTKTETRWKKLPTQGHTIGSFACTVFADTNSGIQQQFCNWMEEIAQKAEGYRLAQDKDFDGENKILDFSIDHEEAMKKRGIAKIREEMEEACNRSITSRTRNLNITNHRTNNINPSRILFPFWIANYTYKEETFQALFSGFSFDDKQGNKPIDKEREALFVEFEKPAKNALTLTTILGVIGICMGVVPGIIIFIIGFIFVYKYKQEANKKKEEVLVESNRIRSEILRQALGETPPPLP